MENKDINPVEIHSIGDREITSKLDPNAILQFRVNFANKTLFAETVNFTIA